MNAAEPLESVAGVEDMAGAEEEAECVLWLSISPESAVLTGVLPKYIPDICQAAVEPHPTAYQYADLSSLVPLRVTTHPSAIASQREQEQPGYRQVVHGCYSTIL